MQIDSKNHETPTDANNVLVAGLSLQQWIILETKETTVTHWGEKTTFTPVISKTIIGDGQQLVYLGTIDQRPYYWLIRIDSKTDIESDDFDFEDILQPLEEEFGRYPDSGILDEEDFNEAKASGKLFFDDFDDYEDYNSSCQYPAIWWGGGHYGLIVNMVTGQIGEAANQPCH